MNTVEHIVECYFRYCKSCFTMTDVKIIGGNNRQCDLLAIDLVTNNQFHVETSVTHDLRWLRSEIDLQKLFDKKFLGIPPKREGLRTDHAKGKKYLDEILQTYHRVGFEPKKVRRVFVTWTLRQETNIENFIASYAAEYDLQIEVWRFRDTILPELMSKISTSNYDDEILRTLSLLKQYDLQMKQTNPSAF